MQLINNYYLGNSVDKSVKVNADQLDLHLDILNLSPEGFDWGRDNNGASQLALAIFCNEFGNDLSKHPAHYEDFKKQVIAAYNPDEYFELSTRQIVDWIKQQNN